MTDIFDAKQYIESFLYIRTKSGRLELLRLNPSQEKLHRALAEQDAAGKPMRAIVLKARQLGFSTYTEARIFHASATAENVNSLILAHLDSSTAELFAKEALFYDCLPEPLRPMRARANDAQIYFDNPDKNSRRRAKHQGLRSRITCNTAGSGSGVGRGATIQKGG